VSAVGCLLWSSVPLLTIPTPAGSCRSVGLKKVSDRLTDDVSAHHYYGSVQRLHSTEYLPSRECVQRDLHNGDDFDMAFTTNAFLQPELREKVKYPEGLTDDRASEIGLITS
jgi:hypothetical protein